MGIYVDLSDWSPEHIRSFAFVTIGEREDDALINELIDKVLDAIDEASDNQHQYSDVMVYELRKEAYATSCDNIDAFVNELELFMQYAAITEPVVVHYSPNEEGSEAGSGWAVVSAKHGYDGAEWGNAALMRAINRSRKV